MKASFIVVASALALAACGQPAAEQPAPQVADANAPMVTAAPPPVVAGDPSVPTPEQVTAAAEAAGLPVTPEERLNLACDNGEGMTVRFFPEQGIAVLVRGGQSTELQREQAEQGMRYSNGQTTVSGYNLDYVVQIGMMAPVQCKAA